MSRNFLARSAGSLALIAALGTAAMAQDTNPAPASDLPEALSALDLQDLEIDQTRRGGRRVEGELPGGGEIMAMIDAENALMMVKAEDAALPQSVIDALLPQSARDNEIIAQFSVIDAVGGREGRVMVGGQDADGDDIRASFDEDGRLVRFGRGDDDRDGPGDRKRGGRQGRHGDDGHGRRGGQEMRGQGSGNGMGPQFDTAALSTALTDAGYTEIGDPAPTGPRMAVDAVNAAGEPVTLEIDRDGEVIRETAR